jgi:hypothetical protein
MGMLVSKVAAFAAGSPVSRLAPAARALPARAQGAIQVHVPAVREEQSVAHRTETHQRVTVAWCVMRLTGQAVLVAHADRVVLMACLHVTQVTVCSPLYSLGLLDGPLGRVLLLTLLTYQVCGNCSGCKQY